MKISTYLLFLGMISGISFAKPKPIAFLDNDGEQEAEVYIVCNGTDIYAKTRDSKAMKKKKANKATANKKYKQKN